MIGYSTRKEFVRWGTRLRGQIFRPFLLKTTMDT